MRLCIASLIEITGDFGDFDDFDDFGNFFGKIF